ncbi:MAG: VOC family protein [Acidobacteriota bacterium]
MQLGSFSLSLAVQDIQASKRFYEALGFVEVGGQIDQNWLILRSGTTTIGLFQGMFEKNIMTFNPGWDAEAEALDEFEDVRRLQQRFEEHGLSFQTKADTDGRGPASFVLVDPDGNAILFDQHVDSPTT